MKRADVVLAIMAGDDGKPRPAVVVQSDEMIQFGFSSLLVCPMTTSGSNRSRVRTPVDPGQTNGLSARSEVMAEKPVGMSTRTVGLAIGHLEHATMAKVDRALLVALGLGRARP